MTLCDEIYRIAKQEAGMMSNVLSKWGYNEKSHGQTVAGDLKRIEDSISKYNPSAIFCRDPCEDIQEFTKSMQLTIAHFNQYIAEIAGVSIKEFLPLKSVESKDVYKDVQNIRCIHDSFISHVNALDPKIDTMGYSLGSDVLEMRLLRDIHQRNRAKSKPPYSNTD